MLSEFVFCSPERPIDDVDVSGPKYRERIKEAESFRESVFADVAAGALEGFAVLEKASRDGRRLVSRQNWQDYFSAFQENLTAEDTANLNRAQNAWHIGQDDFVPVVVKSDHKRTTRRLGIPIGVWRSRAMVEGWAERFYLFGLIPTVRVTR